MWTTKLGDFQTHITATMYGGCCVKHWNKTLTTVSLSPGEAELHGIAAGTAQALGQQALAKDLGFRVTIDILSDATAAIGITRKEAWVKSATSAVMAYGFKR